VSRITELVFFRRITADLWKVRGNFDASGMIAPIFSATVLSFEELIQFLCDLIQRGVSIAVVGMSNQIGPAELHLCRRGIVMGLSNRLIAMQANIDTHDLSVVPKQRGKSKLNGILQGRRQTYMHALHLDFGKIGGVDHGSQDGCGVHKVSVFGG